MLTKKFYIPLNNQYVVAANKDIIRVYSSSFLLFKWQRGGNCNDTWAKSGMFLFYYRCCSCKRSISSAFLPPTFNPCALSISFSFGTVNFTKSSPPLAGA